MNLYAKHVLVLLTAIWCGQAGAQGVPTPGDGVEIPVRIINTVPPIPFELFDFPRQYCATWAPKQVVAENEDRVLVEYTAKLPTVKFDEEVYFSGSIEGFLFGTQLRLAHGHSGQTDVISACPEPPPPSSASGVDFIPNVRGATNQFEVADDVSDFSACEFDLSYPVDIVVVARILEFKGPRESGKPRTPPRGLLIAGEDGEGTVCFVLESVRPRGDD